MAKFELTETMIFKIGVIGMAEEVIVPVDIVFRLGMSPEDTQAEFASKLAPAMLTAQMEWAPLFMTYLEEKYKDWDPEND